MKIALAPEFLVRMFVLFPATLGVGTAVLWARSLTWPLRVDANGLTLRYRGRVPWKSIRKISVWRSYLDGHISRIDIHRHRCICRIPVRALRDGDNVAETIVAMFKESRRSRQMDSTRMDSASMLALCRPPPMPATVERLHLVHNDLKRSTSLQSSAGLRREVGEELRKRLAI